MGPDSDYTEMMTYRWIGFVVALALTLGCAAHDRELMGDPEPEPVASYKDAPPQEPQEEFTPEEATLEGTEVWFDDLRFFGSWYHLDPYGMVWRPVVTMDWSPMMNGYWVWSSYGWVWVSYDPFPDDVYHYGFWINDFALGWVWIPDYVWAPVQAEWVWWDDCIAWAPLPPPGIRYEDPWQEGDDGKWKGGGKTWVTVPVGKFKDTEVGQHRIANPKFKAGSSERTLRREAPDPTAVERGWGHPIKAVDLRLQESVIAGSNFTRVVLPADEQRIVDERRAQVRRQPTPPRSGGNENRFKGGGSGGNSGGTGTGDTGSRSGGGSSGGSGGSGSGSNVEAPKQKGSSPPPAKKEEPAKFKEKAKDSKSKPDSDSKGKGKG